jgi:hypothetical protein
MAPRRLYPSLIFLAKLSCIFKTNFSLRGGIRTLDLWIVYELRYQPLR